MRLFLIAALALISVASGQQKKAPPARPKISQAQIEQLVAIGTPDEIIAQEIRDRGLGFIPTSAIVGALRDKKAGPQVLQVLTERILKVNLTKTCALIGNQDYSGQVTVATPPWTRLNRGQEADGYSFSSEGSLSYAGQLLTHNIPVSGSSDNKWIYAQSITLSPKSPSGRSAILQACTEPDLGGLCWALFVVDHGSHRIERTFAGKYGPEQWVAWIRGIDEYAILRSKNEGSTTYYRIHLLTAQSAECTSNSIGAHAVAVPPAQNPTVAVARKPGTASAEKIPQQPVVPVPEQRPQAVPVPETSPPGTAKETQEVVLTLDGCRIGGYYLLCSFGVTTHGADRKIHVATQTSRLVDSAGRQHQPSNLTLGGRNCSGNCWLDNTLPTNVPFAASLGFDDIPADSTEVQLLEIDVGLDRKFQFRRVPVGR